MKTLRYVLASACLALPTAMVWGCTSGQGSGDGPLGQDEAPFGEAACGTESADQPVSGNVTSCGQSAGHASGSSYGNETGCPQGYKVTFIGNVSSNATAYASWGGQALTDTTSCANAWVAVETFDSSGTAVGYYSARGTWISNDAGLSYCSIPTAGAGVPGGTNTRVVGIAGFNPTCNGKICSVQTLQQVNVYVKMPPC